MFAILAVVCFALVTFGVSHVGAVDLLPLGLAFLALQLVAPLTPWRRP